MNKDIIIDSDEIAEYVYNALIQRGAVPAKQDAEMIADIMFEYFLDMGIIEEINDDCE